MALSRNCTLETLDDDDFFFAALACGAKHRALRMAVRASCAFGLR
jgi:hypothetical protein